MRNRFIVATVLLGARAGYPREHGVLRNLCFSAVSDGRPGNREIADAFALLGDLLALEGAQRHRIRAYHRGAERVRDATASVADLAVAGRATQLPDIGPTLQAKIVELVETGSIAALEAAKERTPPGLVQIAALPGVGPGRAMALWTALGAGDLDALRAAAAAGRLTDVPGIGPKVAAGIAEALARPGADPGDALVGAGIALPLARAFAASLAAHPDVSRVEIAGGLRRGKEDVHDVDIVVATTAPDAVLAHVAADALVDRVVASGASTIAVASNRGVRVEVSTGPPERFGDLLQHATGSAAHNTRLRERAKRMGVSLSQHGWRDDDGEGGTPDEDGVYARLGLRTPPPELREDRGEIEWAASSQPFPRLVTQADLVGQVHVHTTWSDGTESIATMADAARARGHRYLGISDHSRALTLTRGLTPDRVRRQWDEIDRLNAGFDDGFRLLKCTEMDILEDGGLDFDDDLLEGFDLVIASIHSGLAQPADRITARLLAAIASPHVDVIGHPTGRKRPARAGAAIDIDAVVEAAAATGTLLEVNGQPPRQDLDSAMARRALDGGVRLLVSSDAHSVEALGYVEYGIRIARRAGATAADIANAAPWPWTA